MHILTHASAFILEKIALAGGGGSPSGGDSYSGGGSSFSSDSYSSSGSSGSGGELDPTATAVFIFGVLSTITSYHLIGLTRRFSSGPKKTVTNLTILASLSVLLLILSGTAHLFPVVAAAVGVVGLWFGGLLGISNKTSFNIFRTKKARTRAQSVIAAAQQTDARWNEQALIEHAKQVFTRYQADWSAFNLEGIITYTAPDYAKRAALLLQALRQLGRTNRVKDPAVLQATIIDASDDKSTENRDSYSVLFDATATDELIDEDGTILYSSTPRFSEMWSFVRNGDTWVLSGITPGTTSISMGNNSLVRLAAAKNMYYSLDMGWLLIPKRSVVMGNGVFGKSDINNHLIGSYNDHLYQLYIYNATPVEPLAPGVLIMQLSLPKSYGGIIVQRKQKFIAVSNNYVRPPKNYTKYTYGWNEFDDRYDVQATDAAQLASFELINPSFMAFLYDNDPGVGIEVVDSTMYVFKHLPTQYAEVDTASYEVMFAIAERAFKELRL